MKRISLNIIKKISSKNFDMKNHYELYRLMQKTFQKKLTKDYEDRIEDTTLLRIFKNKNHNHKAIIYIHGGGWVTGSVNTYTNICKLLSKQTNRVVIAVDYRLAPEYKFPIGLNDCYEAIEYIYNNPQEFDITNKDLTIMGDSAGGNITAAISLKNRKEHKFKISNQILIYPALQNDYSLATKYPSVLKNGEDYFLTRKMISDYLDLYISSKEDLKNIYVAPLNAKWLFAQPRTLIITADLCPLKDEGYAYYRKLKRYFNYCEYHNIKDVIHGYFSNPFQKKKVKETIQIINNFLGEKND